MSVVLHEHNMFCQSWNNSDGFKWLSEKKVMSHISVHQSDDSFSFFAYGIAPQITDFFIDSRRFGVDSCFPWIALYKARGRRCPILDLNNPYGKNEMLLFSFFP